MVIPPLYDFGTPYSDGIAAVCNGCFFVTKGEHSYVVGGKWGYINRKGKVVIPISYFL